MLPERIAKKIFQMVNDASLEKLDEERNQLLRKVIKLTLERNKLRSSVYPSYVNGLCHYSYLVNPVINKKVLLLGELHKNVSPPSVVDLLKYYRDKSHVFLDIFIEDPFRGNPYINKESVTSQQHNINTVRWIFRDQTCESASYRAHRFDLRDRYYDASLQNQDINKIFKDLESYSFVGLMKKIKKIWNSDYVLKKEKQKITDPTLLNPIYNETVTNTITYASEWDLPDIDHILQMYGPKIASGINIQDSDARESISAIIALAYATVTDWYLLLRLFKRFDSKVQPTTADNCIIYGGGLHIRSYHNFLIKHGFQEIYSNISDDCITHLPSPIPLLEI